MSQSTDTDTMPDDLRNSDFHTGMVVSFLRWAIADEAMRKQFTVDTGSDFMPDPKNGLEAMIDQATGVGPLVASEFIRWAIETQWGWDCAPDSIRKYINDSKAERGGR